MEHNIKLSTFVENQILYGLQNFYDISDNLVAQDDVKNHNIPHVEHKDMTDSSQELTEDIELVRMY